MRSSQNRQEILHTVRRAQSTIAWSIIGDAGVSSGDAVVSDVGEPRLWYAVASSRLGKPVERRKLWFQLLHRVVRRAAADGAVLMIVEGTAAAEWIERAAQLFSCSTVRIRPDEPANKDRLLFELSDRLFVLRARRGGLIARLVQQQSNNDATKTLVAIWPDEDDAGADLVAAGAVGWWLFDNEANIDGSSQDRQAKFDLIPAGSTVASPEPVLLDRLPMVEGGWLIHCTRGRSGPIPGQTEAQWRDEVLLGGLGGADLGPADVLQLIFTQQCLRGQPLGKGLPPVVCFAEVPLGELLARRTFRPHRGRWDYEPFGIAVRRGKLESMGVRPVVYAETFADSKLSANERWRYQATGKTFDWTEEREWRANGSLDLSLLEPSDMIIFVGDCTAATQMAEISRWPVIIAPVNV